MTSYTDRPSPTPVFGHLPVVNEHLKPFGFNLSDCPTGVHFSIPVYDHHIVSTKAGNSAVTMPMLEGLNGLGVDTVVLVGLVENAPICEKLQCVTATALDFVAKGFRVYIVAEGTNISQEHRLKRPIVPANYADEARALIFKRRFDIDVVPVCDAERILKAGQPAPAVVLG